jgi:GntR family transcriptional regulator
MTGQARYQQLAAALVGDIQAGTYAVGDELPTEMELCRRHGVSRFTVREALKRVEEAGLIVRRQGSGSRVVARRRPPQYLLSLNTESEVLRYASETVLEVRHTGPATRAAADRLGVDGRAGWTEIRGVRRPSEGAAPVCTVTVLLRTERAGVLDEVGGTVADAMFARVLERDGLTLDRIEKMVPPTPPPAGDAGPRGGATATPALAIERRYVAEDVGLFEVSLSTHPGDRYAYSLQLDRSGANPRP